MKKPLKTSKTQLVSMRLEHAMLAQLREIGEEMGMGWQTVMKSLLRDAMDPGEPASPEVLSPAEHRLYEAPHVRASQERLRRGA